MGGTWGACCVSDPNRPACLSPASRLYQSGDLGQTPFSCCEGGGCIPCGLQENCLRPATHTAVATVVAPLSCLTVLWEASFSSVAVQPSCSAVIFIPSEGFQGHSNLMASFNFPFYTRILSHDISVTLAKNSPPFGVSEGL